MSGITWMGHEAPLEQVKALLCDDPDLRQSVFFLREDSYGRRIDGKRVGQGDFIDVTADKKDAISGEKPQGLLFVTSVLYGSDGIAGPYLAVSVRPTTDDERETCDECHGERCWSEYHDGGTEYFACEKCGGLGEVAIL